MLAPLLLLLRRLALQRHLLGALPLEAGIAAAPQASACRVSRCRMWLATSSSRSRSWLMTMTVAGIGLEVVDQPHRAFEVEIVGRLVEQQQVGRGEQHRRERNPHAPAAGEFRQARGRCAASSKPRPARMRAARAGAAWASMSASRVWISAMRSGSRGGLGLVEQRAALDVGVEHEVDQRLRAAGRLLLDRADAGVLGRRDRRRSPAPVRRARCGTAWSCRRRCGRPGRRARRSGWRRSRGRSAGARRCDRSGR